MQRAGLVVDPEPQRLTGAPSDDVRLERVIVDPERLDAHEEGALVGVMNAPVELAEQCPRQRPFPRAERFIVHVFRALVQRRRHSSGQRHLRDIQRHRHQAIVADGTDEIDDTALAEGVADALERRVRDTARRQ